MDVLRRVRRWSIEVELTEAYHPDEGDLATSVANRDAIERAFRTLDADLRAIVVPHYYLGLTLPTWRMRSGPAREPRSRVSIGPIATSGGR